MPTVIVPLGPRSYPVVVAAGSLASLGRRTRAVLGRTAFALVVADRNTIGPWGQPAAASLAAAGFRVRTLCVPAGEGSKSARHLEKIWKELAASRAGRDAVVVSVGGGVVGDLAGFAAATWNRGVDLVHVPTTLLAMVDASIGGKTGINLPHGKNLVGAFHQHRLVLADLDTLKTLPDREFRSGLAEVIKYGLIGDAPLFALLEKNTERLLARDPAFLQKIVARCASQKARVVSRDERESGPRMLLNLGHTFGHAIEAATSYRKYLHGEAVAIGLCAAAALSGGGLEARVRSLVSACGLPDRAPGLDPEVLRGLAAGDKKVKAGRVRYVICRGVGSAEVAEGLPEARVQAAWATIRSISEI
ncbi:MAG: 3-dehydroquinate synthase [Planctomycetes bacterium]|nr:3-dehydroquinate synthase [Planctomycetota bacterium]